MQSHFEFLWSGNEFTGFFYFGISTWPYSASVNERGQNVKIHFETQVCKLRYIYPG